MIPTLLELGPFPIRSFGLMVALALIVGALRLAISFSRYGINPTLAERYVMVGGISGLLGARIWFLGENWSYVQHDPFGAIFSSAGFTFYGGFIIAALCVAFVARRDGTKISTLCDALGPCLAIGYAVGRLGCQLSGDGDYGIAANPGGLLSWSAMSYATGVVPTLPGELVYPTPVFESVIAIGIYFLLSWVEESRGILTLPMQRFGLYLGLISIERFLIEFLRPNDKILMQFSEAQVIAVIFIVLGFGLTLLPLILGRQQVHYDH